MAPDDHSADRPRDFATAIGPFVERALHTSVRRDPRPLVEVLVPVLGPAIRRAIGEAFRAMVQSLDHLLSVSLSRRALRWRIEAWRCGKSFAEVALTHSLLFRIEAALLVHRKTGLLLHQEMLEGLGVAQPELVSAMSIALQDFVDDAFRERQPREDSQLRTIQVGELTLWIDHAPLASLVTIVRGLPPESLRRHFSDELGELNRQYAGALERFEGDVTPFAATANPLLALLVEKLKPQPRRPPRKAYLALGFAVALVSVLAMAWLIRDHRWQRFVESLERTPGVVVTGTTRSHGKYVVHGLRDPYADDPRRLLEKTRLDPSAVSVELRPFVSLEPALVALRARKLLGAPEGVALRFEGGKVIAGGHAPMAWIDAARARAQAFAELGLAWREEGLEADESLRLRALERSLETRALRFDPGSSRLRDDEAGELDAMAAAARELDGLARATRRASVIHVVGHASIEGTPAANLRLSRARAKEVRRRLVEKGVREERVRAEGRNTPARRTVDLEVQL